nr:RNA-dependent RNA polymerase [Marmot picobirnavirus]
MKSQKMTAQMQDYVDSSTSLSSYLTSLNEGRKATPHSWLYEEEDATKTLERWIPIMEDANRRNSPFGEEFSQFDRKQLSKFGPQGEIPPIMSDAAQEALEPLFSPSEYDDENKFAELFPVTREFAQVAFGKRLMTDRPLSIDETIDDMAVRDTLSTNSGFPRFTRRSRVSAEEKQDALSGKAYDYPAIVLFRKYYGKLRPVWMYPMSMNLIESSYGTVLQHKLRQSPTDWVREYVTPWTGYEDVKRILTLQWPNSRPIAGGDTSKMDANMRRAQMRLFYEIVKWLFQERYWEDLYKCIMRVNDIELLVGRESMLTGPHGLASGSGWTQYSETVLTMFMAWRKGTNGQGIGDDFYWNLDITAEELVAYLATYGLPANEDKQEISTDTLTFLQRMNRHQFFSRDNARILGAYYPTIRALESSLWPEKFHRPEDWSPDMFCIRQYMILENCVDDPCFVEFLQFVVKGNRHLIPFAKKSAKQLNLIQRLARLIPGLNPSYNQEKRLKPLSEFTSIKLASQM